MPRKSHRPNPFSYKDPDPIIRRRAPPRLESRIVSPPPPPSHTANEKTRFGSIRISPAFAPHQNQEPGGTRCIPWFVDGKRNIVRHDRNQRDQKCVRRRLVQSICDKGIVYGVRGEPWLQAPTVFGAPYRAIGWGSLTDAAYHCFANHAANENVKRVLKEGLIDAVVFNSRMQDDCTMWLVKYHNDFGRDGSPYGFQELMKEIPDMEAAWKLHCHQHGITSRTCSGGDNSYEKQYWRFISAEFEGKANSWQHFESAKTVVHYLKTLGIENDFHDWVSEHVDFDDTRLEKGKAIMVLHAIISKVYNNFNKYLTESEMRALVLEAVKFALPTVAIEGQSAPWIFTDVDQQQVDLLITDMSQSIVVSTEPKKKKGRNSTEDEDMSVPMPSLSKRSNSKSASRPRVFIDDVVLCVRHVTPSVGLDLTLEKRLQKLWPSVFQMCLKFLWTRQVTIVTSKGPKVLRTWSSLRPRLKLLRRGFRHQSPTG